MTSDINLDLTILPEKLRNGIFGHFYDPKFSIDEGGLRDYSQSNQATLLVDMIKLIYQDRIGKDEKSPIIIDFGCSVGGNTLYLSLLEVPVLGIEVLTSRYNNLVNNVAIFNAKKLNILGLGEITPNIFTLKKSLCELQLSDIKQIFGKSFVNFAIGFFDPPWGGTKYDENKTIEGLFYNDNNKTELCDVIEKFQNLLDLVIIKLPYNYNFKNFDKFKDVYYNKLIKIKTSSKKHYSIFILSKFNTIKALCDEYNLDHIQIAPILNDYYKITYEDQK